MESFLTAHISASAVRTNLSLLRGCLARTTKLCAVVKGDCYGHGLDLLLDTIAAASDSLAVVTGAEAIRIRDLGYSGELLVLFSVGPYAAQDRPEPLAELIARDVVLTVVSRDELAAVAQAGERTGKQAAVHVMIDTGMTRSGVTAAEAPRLVESIRKSPHVKLTGLYTHFATADEADKSFARTQLARFTEAVAACGGGDGLTLHAANSAATIELPETHLDMVRTGVSVFGYQPARQVRNKLPLRPALRLTAPLMQVKHVPPDQRVGYGLTYRFAGPGRIGLVPVGYGDGYLRSHSNRATMRVAGRDVPVRGRVSMDQTIVDLTDVPEAKVGDEVQIISADPSSPHSVQNLAALANTIPQEITSRLGGRVRKVLAEGG
ncbi:MAG: alanine racemase [Phycisphaerae bacterium]|nr:alanine racemase [Phycisphaerae bacterium]